MRIFKVFTCLLFCCILLSAEPHHYVAIAPLVGKGFTSEQLSNHTDTFRKKYNEVAKYKAMEQDQMDKNLGEGFERLDIVSEMSYAMAMGRLLSVQCVILGTINKSDKTSKCIIKTFDLNSRKGIKTFTISFKGSPRKFLTAIVPKIVKVVDPVIVEKKEKKIPVVAKSEEKPAEKVKPESKIEVKAEEEKKEVVPADKTEKKQVVSSKAVKKEEKGKRRKKRKKKKIVAAPKASVVAVTPAPKAGVKRPLAGGGGKKKKDKTPETKEKKDVVAKKSEKKELAKPKKKKVVQKDTAEEEKVVSRQKPERKKRVDIKETEKKDIAHKKKVEKETVDKKKDTPKPEERQAGKKRGIITAVATGVSAAIAIPVVIILKSKDDIEEPVQDSFSLTVEW